MSVSEGPPLSVGPIPPGQRAVCGGADLVHVQDKHNALERLQPFSTCEQSDFIPDEILQILTSTAQGIEKPELGQVKKTRHLKDAKGYLRATDQVWHHPFRRNRFKHLTDQPVCLTGAGRDISFLCDALAVEKKNTTVTQTTSRSDKTPRTMERSIEESLIPNEFYIVKNKGVLGLEYYEDKYTTLLEDDEKKLRLFPSMKPSGRAEVIQLTKVMDAMLKQAGIDEDDVQLEGPTQIHNLLELLKTEQNIYNIVFHELIRQVSVECAERGELLSKIRQRYVMLLNKIPRQVLGLYNDLLAQRALDRCLTEEIIYFKNSIGELTDELYQVREHDLRVSKDAKQAQAELAKALNNAKKNANLLEEYRELYELQRSRLEKQLAQLTEERDLWSSATYRLARKVIDENQLQLARRLYMSEKTWTKIVRHFIVLLASTDTKDLSEIQQITERWRDHTTRFHLELQRSVESAREKLQIICRDLKNWQLYFQEKVFVDWRYNGLPEEAAIAILQDVKNWENMLVEEQQQFEGHNVLNSQESLKAASDIQKEWSHLGEKLLKRHQGLDGSPAPEHKAMEDLNNTIEELHEQYRKRVEGENGVAKGLMSFSSSLESWSSPMHPLKHTPNEIKESDWSNLNHLLPDWITHAERILELIGNTESEDTSSVIAVTKIELEDVLKMLQHWVLTTTNGTERDDLQLTQEVTDLHTTMVQYMVNVLMLLSPDYFSDSLFSDTTVVGGFEEEVFPDTVPLQQMQKEALFLSEKLHGFSCYIIKCCQEMVENNPTVDDDGYELRQLQSIKSSCSEWIETCQLLLSKLTAPADPTETSGNSQTGENTKDMKITLSEIQPPQDGANHAEDSQEQVAERDKGPLSSEVTVGTKVLKSDTTETAALDVMRIIGYDGNISKKSLKEEEIPVFAQGVLTASRPSTPRSIQAFESLTSLEQLEKRLLNAELRAQKAEEMSESLEEQLKAALQKIQELEVKSSVAEENNETVNETTAHVEVKSEQLSLPVPTKKRPKSSKAKQHK
ncbi:axonemal dynein light chain domain-containing protein 1 isoform X1 [Bufo gargarizans]|uniref:axonemal dynein light chain domain-containing protein 1 isoform X1 n=1 Tax=Bufo gargarizans TaxID=30331 RepID=UPI001CF4D2E7|nr:axonemal dynein light chain domain-containing protein 1 isoform X1 [Bufo gargarizans]